MARISRSRRGVARALDQDDHNADEQARDRRRDHDGANQSYGAEHHVAHRDLLCDGRLVNGLDDDWARLLEE